MDMQIDNNILSFEEVLWNILISENKSGFWYQYTIILIWRLQ